MNGKRGLFIVIYGPSGVGKTKQLDLLQEKLKAAGVNFRRVDYPDYKLGEAGPTLEKILWGRLPRVPEEEMQMLFAQNRRDFEPTLKSWLDSGVTVLAEDYKGTGMVWGLTRGVSMAKMEEINKEFLEPDVSIMIDGPRRVDLREGEGHNYNTDEDEWYRARKMYLQMADKYGWVRVGGDAPILTVADRIWAVVRLAM
jgi:thymidylate kinase